MFDLCSELESELGVKFSPEVVASLSHLASDKTRRSAEDLEAFAQHAKRTNVTADDVKLLTRRNPKLVKFPQFLTTKSLYHRTEASDSSDSDSSLDATLYLVIFSASSSRQSAERGSSESSSWRQTCEENSEEER